MNNNKLAWKTRRKNEQLKGFKRLLVVSMLLAGIISLVLPEITANAKSEALELTQNFLPTNDNKPFTLQDKKLVAEFIGEVSAYTAGRVEENDKEPCIGAWNNDICQMVKQGKLVFANNYYKNGTLVCIDSIGCGEVRDRMNARYGKEHFDIAGLDLQNNINFGRKNLAVRIYKK